MVGAKGCEVKGQRIDARPKHSCGAPQRVQDCTCCGTQVLDCTKCAYTEWRDGIGYASPLRCFTCATRGCRVAAGPNGYAYRQRCQNAGQPPRGRAV